MLRKGLLGLLILCREGWGKKCSLEGKRNLRKLHWISKILLILLNDFLYINIKLKLNL